MNETTTKPVFRGEPSSQLFRYLGYGPGRIARWSTEETPHGQAVLWWCEPVSGLWPALPYTTGTVATPGNKLYMLLAVLGFSNPESNAHLLDPDALVGLELNIEVGGRIANEFGDAELYIKGLAEPNESHLRPWPGG